MTHWTETQGYGEWTPLQAERYPWYDPHASMVQNLDNKRRWDEKSPVPEDEALPN